MRITNNMLINNMIGYIGNSLTRMEKYQYQLATGKKISVPSDDPVVAARALKLRTDVAEIEQYRRNVKDAASWMEITEDALGKVGDVLQKARDLAVQASNGTNTEDELQKVRAEVDQLRNQLIQLGNSTYAGRYIFSGYKTNKPLLDEQTGRFLETVNNAERILYEVGVGDSININVAGGDLFNGGGNATGDTPGVTAGTAAIGSLNIDASNNTLTLTVDGETCTVTLTAGTYASSQALAKEIQDRVNEALTASADISVNAEGDVLSFTTGSRGDASAISIDGTSAAAANLGLAAAAESPGTTGQVGSLIQNIDSFIAFLDSGDYESISNLLADIDGDINNVLRLRADVGARENRTELTLNRLESDSLNFTKLMSENEDVDAAEAILNLKSEENVYRASLAGGARIIMPTLLDFLR